MPARRYVVAEVGRRHRVSNTLVKRAPKRAAGASEQGPSAVSVSAGRTAGGVIGRKERRRSCRPARNAGSEMHGKQAQGDERSSSSGRTGSRKAEGVRSRDRGHKVHRIPRRVPADGRCPGSRRSTFFHESAWKGDLGRECALRPEPPLREEDVRRRRSPCEGGGGGGRTRLGDGDIRGSIDHRRRGTNTPTLVTPGREAMEHGNRVDDGPPKRARGS